MKNNGGDHYHVALKLASPKRWKSVTKIITSLQVFVVSFCGQHENDHIARKPLHLQGRYITASH